MKKTKVAERNEQTALKRCNTSSQEAYENIFNFNCHQGNINQCYIKIPFHQNWNDNL